VVGRRAVLTAAHCAADGAPRAIYLGREVGASAGAWVGVADVTFHPTRDLCVLGLVEDAPVEPVPIAVDAAGVIVGAPLRIVGFGADGMTGSGVGTKRTGTTVVTSVSDFEIDYSAAPSSTCVGDSGGPALLATDGGEVVVGVTSRGTLSCTSAIDERVDTAAEFVRTAIASTEADPSPDGCAVGVPSPGGAPDLPLVFTLVLVASAAARRRGGVSLS